METTHTGKPNHPIRLRFRWSCFTKKASLKDATEFSARFLVLKVQVVSLEWFCLHFAAAKEDEIGVTSVSTKFVVTLTLCAWVDTAKVYFFGGSCFEISESSRFFQFFQQAKVKSWVILYVGFIPMPNKNPRQLQILFWEWVQPDRDGVANSQQRGATTTWKVRCHGLMT